MIIPANFVLYWLWHFCPGTGLPTGMIYFLPGSYCFVSRISIYVGEIPICLTSLRYHPFFQQYILTETSSCMKTKYAPRWLYEILSPPQLEGLRMASLTALARDCFSSRVQRNNFSAVSYGWKPCDKGMRPPRNQRFSIYRSLMSKVTFLSGKLARLSRLCISASHWAPSSRAISHRPFRPYLND